MEQVFNLKSAFFQQRRIYKRITRRKSRDSLKVEKQKLLKLRGEAPKVFWKKLKNPNKKDGLNFSNDELASYFSNLLSSEGTISNINQELQTSSLVWSHRH